jgi:hypothetical protein
MRAGRLALVCLALLACAAPAWAQLTRGIISGTVSDSSGGVLPGVLVTVTNQATGAIRTAITAESGVYRAPALEPGAYEVKAELQGFKTYQVSGIQVASGQEVTLNPALAVGGLEETVQVTGDAAGVTINRTNATVGLVLPARQIVELPISPTRDVTRVALLSPNVVSGPGAEGISANGQRSRNNNFMIDGSDNNDASVTISTTPVVPEAIAEIAVQTNPYNVEYGRSSGAQFNVITKSGSNQFRGDVFDYYANSKYNARSKVEKRTGCSSSGSSRPTSAARTAARAPRPTSRRRPATPPCRTCRCVRGSRRRAARRCSTRSASCRRSTGRTRSSATCGRRPSTACRWRSGR